MNEEAPTSRIVESAGQLLSDLPIVHWMFCLSFGFCDGDGTQGPVHVWLVHYR